MTETYRSHRLKLRTAALKLRGHAHQLGQMSAEDIASALGKIADDLEDVADGLVSDTEVTEPRGILPR